MNFENASSYVENILEFFEPLLLAIDSQKSAAKLFADLGYSVPEGDLFGSSLSQSVEQLLTALDTIDELVDVEDPDSPEDAAILAASVLSLLESARSILGGVSNLGVHLDTELAGSEVLANTDIALALPRRLVDFLVWRFLTKRCPTVLSTGALFGLFHQETVTANTTHEVSHSLYTVEWSKLSRLFDSPIDQIANTFVENNVVAYFKALSILRSACIAQGLFGHYAEADETILRILNPSSENLEAVANIEDLSVLSIPIFDSLIEGHFVDLYPLLDPISLGFNGLAAWVKVGNNESIEIYENTVLETRLSNDLVSGFGVLFRKGQGIDVVRNAFDGGGDNSPGANTSLCEAIVKRNDLSESDPLLSIGLGESTTCDIWFSRFSVAFRNEPNAEVSAELIIRINTSAVDSSDGDSFVSSQIPGNILVADFETGLRFSSVSGINLVGSGSLEAAIPYRSHVGPVEVSDVSIRISADSEFSLRATTSIAVDLGPFKAKIRGIGASLTLSFDETSSLEFGPIGIRPEFKPPDGVGLSIDGGGFKGGGFFGYEPEDERYVGMLELQFKDKISLKAIGILTTKLPGDDDGYSLLIIMTAEFQPIQLGYGFTLNGVGGLLGLNRTMNVERLRTGVRDKTLDSVLFPQDIVANANRIISDLRQVFPPSDGRFVFGPMAKIGWGTPTLITIDLGLAIELPEPVTLALLGVLKAVLPDEKKRLLQLRVNFLGVIDFEKEQLSFDASLFDSKLLKFTLSGDMALRLNWGNSPNFLLTVGGFHPAYEPPPMALPTLRRLTVQLLAGKNPRITLETYFAITSNTVQLGAKAELYAGAGPFNVYGILAFDALFQFSPFYFIADTKAMMALRRKSNSIASIKVDLTLEGTTPWKAKGTAKLKICWFLTVKIRFNKTFGRSEDTRLDDLTVLPMLEAALQNPGNWESALPPRRQMLVSIKESNAPADHIIVHPFGALSVNQKVVPLNVQIDKVGHQRPRDGNKFAITAVSLGTQSQASIPTKEFFAPAQFFDKSDEEKLTSKSFEVYDSGVQVSGTDQLTSDHVVRREVDYKLSYIDSQRNFLRKPKLVAPYALAFNAWSNGGAVSMSPLSRRSAGQTTLAPSSVSVSNDHYVLVGMDNMQPVDGVTVARGESEVKALMNEITKANPALLGKIQAVPSYELL